MLGFLAGFTLTCYAYPLNGFLLFVVFTTGTAIATVIFDMLLDELIPSWFKKR